MCFDLRLLLLWARISLTIFERPLDLLSRTKKLIMSAAIQKREMTALHGLHLVPLRKHSHIVVTDNPHFLYYYLQLWFIN